MRVRLQLYTVPGQVFYNTTRKLVLKGVDGVVFVADSQVPAMDANIESLENLRQNLSELNQPLDNIPFVLQYNKRDLRNIQSVEILNRFLNQGGYEFYEAAALHGIGVFETLKAISKKTLASVHRRIAGVETRVERVPRPARMPPTGPRPEPSRRISRSSPPVSVDTDPLKKAEPEKPMPGTAEVKVEFAAETAPTPAEAVEPKPVPTIRTKSRIDIERELEKLRRIAWGGSRPTTTAKPKVSRARTRAQGDHHRQIEVDVPKEWLDESSQVLLEIRFSNGDRSRKFPETLRIDLPTSRRTDSKSRLSITLDVVEEEE